MSGYSSDFTLLPEKETLVESNQYVQLTTGGWGQTVFQNTWNERNN